jgi:hypothetical protein
VGIGGWFVIETIVTEKQVKNDPYASSLIFLFLTICTFKIQPYLLTPAVFTACIAVCSDKMGR